MAGLRFFLCFTKTFLIGFFETGSRGNGPGRIPRSRRMARSLPTGARRPLTKRSSLPQQKSPLPVRSGNSF
ncbi:MAG: hypothetical protein C6W57_12975 [Caldibacillus debilis]|nr:hypothetical protein [Bacillaceae bacterium]REJ14829.1 MAG: hypothetical protein C6W57_12975 [Caldibacillus debilis]REJ26168.1 MAG: hypothetical protein C6W56_12825 [Caldibacillus debilis]